MNSIANARDYLNKKVVDKFIPISVTEDVENKMHLELDIPWEAPNAGESLAGYIVNLPTLLLVKNGEIQAVIERELPSAYFFKTFYIDSEEDTEP